MKIDIITNSDKQHLEIVSNLVSSFDELYILLAFSKGSGFLEIEKHLKENVKKDKIVNMVIGLDLFVTEPEALYSLYDIIEKNEGSKLYLYQSLSGTYNPKIYACREKEEYRCLVGSANLTESGLQSNIEASIYYEDKSDDSIFNKVASMFKGLVSDEACSLANPINIAQYERDYNIYRNKEKDNRIAADTLYNFQTGDIGEYLNNYSLL